MQQTMERVREVTVGGLRHQACWHCGTGDREFVGTVCGALAPTGVPADPDPVDCLGCDIRDTCRWCAAWQHWRGRSM